MLPISAEIPRRYTARSVAVRGVAQRFRVSDELDDQTGEHARRCGALLRERSDPRAEGVELVERRLLGRARLKDERGEPLVPELPQGRECQRLLVGEASIDRPLGDDRRY